MRFALLKFSTLVDTILTSEEFDIVFLGSVKLGQLPFLDLADGQFNDLTIPCMGKL